MLHPPRPPSKMPRNSTEVTDIAQKDKNEAKQTKPSTGMLMRAPFIASKWEGQFHPFKSSSNDIAGSRGPRTDTCPVTEGTCHGDARIVVREGPGGAGRVLFGGWNRSPMGYGSTVRRGLDSGGGGGEADHRLLHEYIVLCTSTNIMEMTHCRQRGDTVPRHTSKTVKTHTRGTTPSIGASIDGSSAKRLTEVHFNTARSTRRYWTPRAMDLNLDGGSGGHRASSAIGSRSS
ncbi:hypothetical protein Tco_1228035 [Tanacetum coccineum]